MRTFVIVVLFALVALVAAAAGFQAGIMSNVAAGGSVPYVWLWGFPHFGGFLFFLLILGLLLFAFGGRQRWGGHRGWGRGYGPMGDPDDPRRQWIAEAHRRLHDEEARAFAAGQDRPAGSPTGSNQPPAG